jgi:hypothetical protein
VDGEQTSLESKKPHDLHKFWDKEVRAAEKRLRTFGVQGNKVVDRYLDERKGAKEGGAEISADVRLNLFYTNVTTLQSMLYGQTPKISVDREHKDPDDDIARVASVMIQRILTADVRTSGDDLSTTLHNALQDRLLPGLGQGRVVYNFTGDDEKAKIGYTHWQDFMWGWCRTWSECPWVAFRAYMGEKEVTKRFSEAIAKQLEYKKRQVDGDQTTGNNDDSSVVEKAEIWEIWCKKTRKVYWYCQGADKILDVRDDPLSLRSFWPCPMPMAANVTTRLFVPEADYILSQDLYNQIDRLATRIGIITRAVKVVGVYDTSETGVKRMMEEGVENDLIPIDNWAMFAEKGGLSGTIDWFPVQEVVGVLATLRQVLSETIELLYQVTGMSDVLRGANTDQYTSDGTNQLKAKFGSIRVQALQDDFARFAADLAEIKAEIVCKHFSRDSIIKESAAKFLPQPDLPLVPKAIDLMQSEDFAWRVDIKPESLAMVDYAQLKAERTEFLTAMATYIQSAQAAVQQIPGSLPLLLEMLKWGMAGFKGANYLEGIMDQAIEKAVDAANQPQQDDAAKQQQADQQLAQMEHQMEMTKLNTKSQLDMQVQQQKAQAAMQQEMLDHKNKMQQEMVEHQNEMAKLKAEFEADIQLVMQNLQADLNTERAQSAYAMEEGQQAHLFDMEEAGLEHGIHMAEAEKDAEVAARQANRETDTD